jgi:ankyrin repeat protein
LVDFFFGFKYNVLIKGREESIKALISAGKSKGLDVNAPDNVLWTPLHIAVAKGHEACVK